MVTTLTTMSDLRSLVQDDVVTVGTNANSWTFTSDGMLRRFNFTVDPSYFEADLNMGRVKKGVRPEAGQLWAENDDPSYGHSWLILDQVAEAEQSATIRRRVTRDRDAGGAAAWWVIEFYMGQFAQVVQRTERSLERSARACSSPPEWASNNVTRSMGVTLLQQIRQTTVYEREMAALTEARNSERTRLTEELSDLRGRIQSGIHAYVREHEEARERLDALLVECGMRASDQVVTVEAVAHPSMYVPVPPEAISEQVGGYEIQHVGEALARYNVPFTKEIPVEAGACGCYALSRNDARAALNDLGIAYVDLSWNILGCSSRVCTVRPSGEETD